MSIDFKEIPAANTGNGDQDTFELFARDFFEVMGFEILEHPSRGADGKKDLIVSERRHGKVGTNVIKWLVSVKHYAHSGRGVPDKEEINILERVRQHKCDGFLGFYSTLPTSSLSNLLNGLKEGDKNSIEVAVYDNKRIERTILHDFNLEKELLFKRYFRDSYLKYQELERTETTKGTKEKQADAHDNNEVNFLTSRDAVVSVEIEKIKFRYYSYDWEEGEKVLNELNQYQEISSPRIAKNIYTFLLDLADRARGGMPGTTAAIIYWMLPTFYISPYEVENRALSIRLKKLCVKIASSMIYDASLYTNELKVAAYGYHILKFVYLKAVAHDIPSLEEEILKQYQKFQDIFDKREGQDLSLAKELLNTFKDDLKTPSSGNPFFKGELREIILDR